MSCSGKQVPQGPGWACFRCGDVFLTELEAEDHFGSDDYEDSEEHDPGCVQVLNFTEKALRAALMDMHRDWLAGQGENARLDEELDHLRGLESSIGAQIESCFGRGVVSVSQAWMKMDSVEGRALTAEAIIAAIEKRAPDLVAAAREEVCRLPLEQPS